MFNRIAAALAAILFSGAIAFAITVSGTWSEQQNAIAKIGYSQLSTTNTITAFAGGGQTSAVQLVSAYNRVTVVATTGDSVKLPLICTTQNVGLTIWVSNAAANNLNAFPGSGDVINLLSADTAIAVPTIKSMIFVCVAANTWQSVLSG